MIMEELYHYTKIQNCMETKNKRSETQQKLN